MIVGIIAVMGACKKSEKDSSTTATATCAGMTVAEVTCNDTASGSITGIDNMTMSGTYDPYHQFGIAGIAGVDNTTGCISAAGLLASLGGPTGTASILTGTSVTSSSSMATKFKYYSDTSCTTEIASIVYGFTEVTVGDNVTTSTSVSGKSSTYPSTATQVTYKTSCIKLKGSNAAGVTFLDNLYGGALEIDAGTEYSCANSGSTYLLMHLLDTSALSVGTDAIFYFDDNDSAYPTDWTSGVSTFTKMP